MCQHRTTFIKLTSFFLPYDTLGRGRGRKTFKYTLTVVDAASKYKEAEPLTLKEATAFADAFQRIYKHGPLRWPQLLQVDPGRKFIGAISRVRQQNGVTIRRGRLDIHCDQAIVERFNCTLAEWLFGHQYAVEMGLPPRQRSTK